MVLHRGNGHFPGGSISENVLRGPVRKEITTVQRAGRDVPKRATPQTSICPSCIQCFAHSSPSPPTLLSYAAEHRDRGAQQHSTAPMLPAVPLCGLPCLVIMITADPFTRNPKWPWPRPSQTAARMTLFGLGHPRTSCCARPASRFWLKVVHERATDTTLAAPW